MLLSVGIFFISLSVLVFELILIRFFSVTSNSSLSFLAITLALFGLALGGILVYMFPKYFSEKDFKKRLGLFAFIYGLSLLAYVLLLSVLENFAGSSNPAMFGIIMVFSAAPFSMANICLSLIFKNKVKQVYKLYFADLIGAA